MGLASHRPETLKPITLKREAQMKQIEIVNKQKSGKYSGTSRTINVPDFLLSGNYAEFLADQDIDHEKAFAAIVNYAKQHLPVAFRSKPLNAHSCYKWLMGEMVGGSQEKAEGIDILVKAGMDLETLKAKSTKEIRSMVDVYKMLHPED